MPLSGVGGKIRPSVVNDRVVGMFLFLTLLSNSASGLGHNRYWFYYMHAMLKFQNYNSDILLEKCTSATSKESSKAMLIQ